MCVGKILMLNSVNNVHLLFMFSFDTFFKFATVQNTKSRNITETTLRTYVRTVYFIVYTNTRSKVCMNETEPLP